MTQELDWASEFAKNAKAIFVEHAEMTKKAKTFDAITSALRNREALSDSELITLITGLVRKAEA